MLQKKEEKKKKSEMRSASLPFPNDAAKKLFWILLGRLHAMFLEVRTEYGGCWKLRLIMNNTCQNCLYMTLMDFASLAGCRICLFMGTDVFMRA